MDHAWWKFGKFWCDREFGEFLQDNCYIFLRMFDNLSMTTKLHLHSYVAKLCLAQWLFVGNLALEVGNVM